MAMVFLPSHMRQVMNLETSLLLKRESGLSIRSLAVNFLNAIVLKPFFGGEGLNSPCLFSTERRSILRRVNQNYEPRANKFAHATLGLRYLGRLAPYFERLRLRPSTPRASRVPRT